MLHGPDFIALLALGVLIAGIAISALSRIFRR